MHCRCRVSQVRSLNHWWRGKLTINYIMCVCVCSLSYTICITNYFFVVLHCSLWPDWVFHLFCILSHKNQKFGEYILYTKCVFWIPIQMLSQTLFILITIQSDITITAPTVHFHVHCSLSSHNLVAPEFSTQFRKRFLYIYIYIYLINFTKIRPAADQFFHTDRKTKCHTWRS